MNVERLKKDAKRLKKTEGIPHHEALDRIAQREGHPHWPALIRASASNPQTQPES